MDQIVGKGCVSIIEHGDVRLVVDSYGAKVLCFYFEGVNQLFYDVDDIGHSGVPLCLPSFGPLKNGEFIWGEGSYKMGQHGFIRDTDFVLIGQTTTSLTYEMGADNSTKERYPFDFKLQVNYKLLEDGFSINLSMSNDSEVDMPIAPGVHPYFAVNDTESIGLDTLAVEANNNIDGYEVQELDLKGYFSVEKLEGKKQLTVRKNPDMHLINHGLQKTHIFRQGQLNLAIDCDQAVFNRMAIWRKAEDSAFICVEPAYVQNGLNDSPLLVSPGQAFQTEIAIQVVN